MTAYIKISKELYERICWILIAFFNPPATVEDSDAIDTFVNLGDSWSVEVDR